MEREKELIKLINVLRRTGRMALQSEWTGGKEDAAAFCTDQYNRVLTRLKELDPGVGTIFDPLPAGRGFPRGYGFGFDPKMFKEFWEKSAREFEDMGEFIRESIDEWLRHKKEVGRAEKGTTEGSKQ